MQTSIANTQFIILMKLRKSFVSINIKRTWINKEKLIKNTSIYQNLIVFSWIFVSFKKSRKYFEIIIYFIFITIAHTKQNNNKKNLQRSLKIMSSNTKKKLTS